MNASMITCQSFYCNTPTHLRLSLASFHRQASLAKLPKILQLLISEHRKSAKSPWHNKIKLPIYFCLFPLSLYVSLPFCLYFFVFVWICLHLFICIRIVFTLVSCWICLHICLNFNLLYLCLCLNLPICLSEFIIISFCLFIYLF